MEEELRKMVLSFMPHAVETDDETDNMSPLFVRLAVDANNEPSFVCALCDLNSNTFVVKKKSIKEVTLVSHHKDFFISTVLSDLEERIDVLISLCVNSVEVASCWAAVYAALSDASRSRIKRIGDDPDIIQKKLDKFFLLNPES